MKKILMMAAVALMLTACGNKNNANNESKDGDSAANTEATGKAEAPATKWTTYTNEKHGFSVEVPAGLIQRETMLPDDGTIFSADGEEGITFNRIDISGHKDIFDEEYTPEKVKKDFEDWTKNMGDELASKECGEDYYTYTVKSDIVNELHMVRYKGTEMVTVVILYEPENEDMLGGDVAKHVFESIKFK